jgi:hypothetical protein
MFVQSHLLLAEKIARGISADLPEQLPLGPFLLGAVYPDFSPRYKKISHNLEGALPTMQELIPSVWSAGTSQAISERQAFEMGIICHFLCDFFCQAHNFKEYQSVFCHVCYEIQMDIFIYNGLRKPTATMIRSFNDFQVKPQGVMELIENTHQQYLTATRALMTDLCFAVACSTAVMKNCLRHDISIKTAA